MGGKEGNSTFFVRSALNSSNKDYNVSPSISLHLNAISLAEHPCWLSGVQRSLSFSLEMPFSSCMCKKSDRVVVNFNFLMSPFLFLF